MVIALSYDVCVNIMVGTCVDHAAAIESMGSYG